MIVAAAIASVLVIIAAILLFYSFSVGVLFGAPYLPTLASQRRAALELLDLKPGQTLYDLGCGDGRMLKAAARSGLNAVGYELSPALVIIARAINWRYRKQVKVLMGNYWPADISQADGIFVFLLDKYMPRLDKKLNALGKPVRLASYTFQIPGRKPTAKKDGVFLYLYGEQLRAKSK
jgi:SAM-dependent methyltransferase